MSNCASGAIKTLAGRPVVKISDLDGYKFFFSDDEWIMIRASGTEPVIRTYCETTSSEQAFAMLKLAHKDLLG